ncbi:MAG: hypothetical protein HXX13_04695 [Bacteroidetes bacterium]|nr:hypothetical protein [Bacteroidota bacterium]
MKKITGLCFILFIFITHGYSQNYKQAAGLRLGAAGGITYRRMLGTQLAGEVMLNSQNRGTVLTLLVEKHRPALLFDKFVTEFYYGAGAHVGIADHSKRSDPDFPDPEWNSTYHGTVPQMGIDGYASFEYSLARYPVVINLDCKPFIEFFDDHFLGMHLPVIAVGAKYVF